MREYLSPGCLLLCRDDWQQAFPYNGSSVEVSWQMTVSPVVFSFFSACWKYDENMPLVCTVFYIVCKGWEFSLGREGKRAGRLQSTHHTGVYARGLCALG